MDSNLPRPNNIMEVITQYFKEAGIKYRRLNAYACKPRPPGAHKNQQILVFSKEDERLAVCYTTMPLTIRPGQRPVVAEYLSRANSKLLVGNFEIDYESGDVRFRTSVDVEGGVITTKMAKHLLFNNLAWVEEYAKGLIGVLYRDLTPAQAIAELEGHGGTQRRAAQAALN